MDLIDHEFTVPLDHERPAGESLSVFARAVKRSDNADATKPWLVFLQGGPRFPGTAAAREYGLAEARARRLSRAAARFARQRAERGRAPADARAARRCPRAGRLPDAFPRRCHRARRRNDPARSWSAKASRGAFSARATAGSARCITCPRIRRACAKSSSPGGCRRLRAARTTITGTPTPKCSARRASSSRATRRTRISAPDHGTPASARRHAADGRQAHGSKVPAGRLHARFRRRQRESPLPAGERLLSRRGRRRAEPSVPARTREFAAVRDQSDLRRAARDVLHAGRRVRAGRPSGCAPSSRTWHGRPAGRRRSPAR